MKRRLPFPTAITFAACLLAASCRPSADDGANDESAVTTAADEAMHGLCMHLTENRRFDVADLEAVFTASYLKALPIDAKVYADALSQELSTITTRYGSCARATRHEDPHARGPNPAYVLEFRDGYRMFLFDVEATDGKIAHQLGLGQAGTLRPASYFATSEHAVRMADGHELRTLVFTKAADLRTPKPVVLVRTPYFQLAGHFRLADWSNTASFWLEQGYTFVLQAIRGTAGSEGEYRLFSPSEIDDARATLDWIAGQKISNGKVAVVGTSYEGFTALAAGITAHPSIALVMAGGAPTDNANGSFIRNGVHWLRSLNYLRYNILQQGLVYAPDFEARALRDLLGEADLHTYDTKLFGQTFPDWQKIADNYPDLSAPFWKERQILSRVGEITAPTYHVGGTLATRPGDCCGGDSLGNFLAGRAGAHADAHRLVLGPWEHGDSTPYQDGSDMHPLWRARVPAIFAHHLKGEHLPFADARVVFIRAEDHHAPAANARVLESNTYPLPGTPRTLYFARPSEGAPLTLAPTPPAASDAGHSSYQDRPSTPNPLGQPDPNQNLFARATFTERTALLGDLSLDLRVRVTVDGIANPQADIIAIPMKVDAHTQAMDILTVCKLGGRVAQTGSAVMKLATGACPVQAVFQPGDQLIVRVTSNLFPLYVRNTHRPARDKDFYAGFTTATIELFHSAAQPSSLTFRQELPAQP